MELFVQGTFVEGALDEYLTSSSENFPLDVCGRPTFRPSAKWFHNQLDFTTAIKPVETRMSSVVTAGKDLQLNKKVKGVFYDEYDGLANFPFDMQTLSVRFVLNCANEGTTPIDFVLCDELKPFVVDQQDFADRNAWVIADKLDIAQDTVGISASRRFPALAINVHVYRSPFFYLVNIALPAGTFALLGVMLLLLPVNYPPSRLTYLLTLMLTLVAYKLATNAHMPTVTYLTVLDRYQLFCAAIVLGIVFESVFLGAYMHAFRDDEHHIPLEVDVADKICFGVFLVAWLWLNWWWMTLVQASYGRLRSVGYKSWGEMDYKRLDETTDEEQARPK